MSEKAGSMAHSKRGLGGAGRGRSVRIPDPREAIGESLADASYADTETVIAQARARDMHADSSGDERRGGARQASLVGESRQDLKHRTLWLPDELLRRIEASGIDRRDVIIAGAHRHARRVYDHSVSRPRRSDNTTKIGVRLTDADYRTLKAISEARQWSLSNAAAVVAGLYLDEVEPAAS